MDAWERLPREGKKLVLVGDGPFRGKLEERGGEGVIFAGYRTGDDLAAAYASGDLPVRSTLRRRTRADRTPGATR